MKRVYGFKKWYVCLPLFLTSTYITVSCTFLRGISFICLRVIEERDYGSTDAKPVCCLLIIWTRCSLLNMKKLFCTTRNISCKILFYFFSCRTRWRANLKSCITKWVIMHKMRYVLCAGCNHHLIWPMQLGNYLTL